ncbi:MAG: hypothetical protein COW18_00020 [Zetaproteobacteria bacterium CG12_big_fil_rev_8_21_14_0_65_54_13]|nr:MAG: hypothetical protein COW18_00020 [Zetaproteobacteria bacterium CG12_big_fil_rev_8_21_14_0_65_54_13]PIX55716.1 MAG: hypothetical protein COZ50_01265 [Zetaproteobacteria bacterium CG_4_10_14_3_um_filter_54_28]PJA29404.1 MAG: hypothetical protein CO188_06675 [Zetaproteobacteria bacterium CG_4_9_14_3_um_filter_54_145]
MRITAYISGHGFGHLAQLAPVLNAIHDLHPDGVFLIRCELPEAELKARLSFDFELDRESVDVGVVQKSAIEEDKERSIIQMRDWLATMDARVQREIVLLRDFAPTLVLSDISPLAFPAAKALAVPAMGLATLDWHTIYSHWLDATDPVLHLLAAAYSACELLLTPPMAMTMPIFGRQRPIPLIVATPQPSLYSPPTVERKIALVIFGGTGQPVFDVQALAGLDAWHFLIPHASVDTPANVTGIDFGPDLRAVDVMPHVDVVVCKPGYGILAECWQTHTPIAWVERPDFPEFPMLKGWLEQHLPSAGMSRRDFAAARWGRALNACMHIPFGFPDTGGDGAQVAAQICLNWRSIA